MGRSMNGIRNTIPGPRVPTQRPTRKRTIRWYSRMIRIGKMVIRDASYHPRAETSSCGAGGSGDVDEGALELELVRQARAALDRDFELGEADERCAQLVVRER